MRLHRLLSLCLFVVSGWFAVSFWTDAAASPADPQPLPHDCGGVTPVGEPEAACCALGYVLLAGDPVAGAAVIVESRTGQVEVSTAAHQTGSAPYYQINLAAAPLSVVVGDLITLTATYAGHTARVTQRVTASGQQVDLHLDGPDLIVERIDLSPPNAAPGEPVTIMATVRNQGDGAAGTFTAHLYVASTAQPPTQTTPSANYNTLFGLESGATYQFGILDLPAPAGCYAVYAWVDRDGDVTESQETNNLAYVDSCFLCQPDVHEPDDSCAAASALATDGTRQTHNLCPRADTDWFTFQAIGGTTYTMTATAVGSDAAIVLSLSRRCPDPPSFGSGAQIVWRAPTTGAYYLMAEHRDADYGPETGYRVAVTGSAPALPVKTLIVTNRARVQALYGAAAATSLMTRLDALARYPAAPGLVIQVENDGAAAAAYAAWTAAPLSTAAANQVADAVRAVIMAALVQHPDVEFIVLAGDDRVIPFRRTPDRTGYPESLYARQVTTGTTLHAALADSMILGDDFYADRMPTDWAGGELYLPDYGLGRLVQTPAEMIAQIDAFLASDQVVVDRALVTGYDLVADTGDTICALARMDLAASGGADCTLVGGNWDGGALAARQFSTAPRWPIQAINGHANHRSQGAPVAPALTAADIVAGSGAALAGALVYSPGCHAGFNDVGDEAGPVGLDLAQAYARSGATYLANTGYGWGDANAIAYSERLMVNVTEELLAGDAIAIGQAVAAAKARYFSESHTFTIYDEKILLELVLYGMPMRRYRSGGVLASEDPYPSVAVSVTAPLAGEELGVRRLTLELPAGTAALQETTTATGAFYALDERVQAAAAMPLQPLYAAPMPRAAVGTVHGALFTGGRYTVRANFTPLLATPVNEYASVTPPLVLTPGFAPAVLWQVNHAPGLSAEGATLTALFGQYSQEEQAQRLYTHLEFDLYDSASADWTPPTILDVETATAGSTRLLEVAVSDAEDVVRVAVVYTDGGGMWQRSELAHIGASDRWAGAIPADAAWIVQAVDGAGNVATAVEEAARQIYLPVVN